MLKVTILSTARSVGDARLHRLAEALVSAGAQVQVCGHGPRELAPEEVDVAIFKPGSRVKRFGRSMIAPFRASGDVLIVVDPDLFPFALIASRFTGTTLVCDVYEDYLKVVSDRDWIANRGVRLVAKVLLRLCLGSAGRAELTMVADEHVRPDKCRRRLVVRNEARFEVRSRIDAPSQLHLAYVGDVRKSRGALQMIEVVRRCPEWNLDIVGPVAGSERAEIEAAAAGCARIRLLGRQTPRDSWKLVERASAGFSLLDSTPAYRDAFPSKIYEYAASGMAVITSPLQRPAALVTEHALGAVVATADEAVALLRRWAADVAELDSCRQNALQWAEHRASTEHPADLAASKIMKLVRLP